MKGRSVCLAAFFALIPLSVHAEGAVSPPDDTGRLVAQYREACAWTGSASMRVRVTKMAAGSERKTVQENVLCRRDDCGAWDANVKAYDENGQVWNAACWTSHGVIGYPNHPDKLIEVVGVPSQAARPAFVRASALEEVSAREVWFEPMLGLFLEGAIIGSGEKSVADLLDEGEPLMLGSESGPDGEPCSVVQVDSPYGMATVWIAPSKGFHALKAIVEKGPGDIWNSSRRKRSLQRNEHWTAEVIVSEMGVVGSDFVPIAGTLRYGPGTRANMCTERTFVAMRTDIAPATDETLQQALRLDIPDGTRVCPTEGPAPHGACHEWRKGRIAVVAGQRVQHTAAQAIEWTTTFPTTVTAALTRPTLVSMTVTTAIAALIAFATGLMIGVRRSRRETASGA